MDEKLSQIAREGYAILEDVVSMDLVAAVLENLTKLYTRFTGVPVEYVKGTPWVSRGFDEQLLELRMRDPEMFGALYDSAQNTVALTQLVTDPVIVDKISTLLGVDSSDLCRQGFELRMDAPLDQRNKLGWHQDQSYFLGNNDGLNGLILWLPLLDVDPTLGPLDICPGSHAEGHVGPRATKWRDPDSASNDSGNIEKTSPMSDDKYITSEQLPVADHLISKYETVSVPLRRGDAVVFNYLLFHRSGENTSNRFRLSAQCRFHIGTNKDFIPFLMIPRHNRFVERMLSGTSQ